MRRLLVTFFYAGLSPVAPGTVGSLAASAILYFIFVRAAPSFTQWQVLLGAGLLLGCVVCVALGNWAVDHYQRKDPQMVVMDEAAGICLSNLFLPLRGAHAIGTIAAAFVAFRIFDVIKPPPARQLEKLPAGWGILLDDLAAAIYANLLCQVLLRLVF